MPRFINPDITRGVNIGFTALMIPPLSVMMCIGFYRAQRSKDPARVTTAYFKAMLPLAILYVQPPPLPKRRGETGSKREHCGELLDMISRDPQTLPTDFGYQ